MTTELQLRDLLRSEAGAPTGGSADWEDVVRRGRRRRRTRRRRGAGTLVLIAIAIAVIASGDLAAIGGHDERHPVTVEGPADPGLPVFPARLQHARAAADFLIVTSGYVDLEDWWPGHQRRGYCEQYGLQVSESGDGLVVDVVPMTEGDTEPWVDCLDPSMNEGLLTGTIRLTEPVGDGRIVDGRTAEELETATIGPLLIPASVPPPFDLDEWAPSARGGVIFEDGYLVLEIAPLSGANVGPLFCANPELGEAAAAPQTVAVARAANGVAELCAEPEPVGTAILRMYIADGRQLEVRLGLDWRDYKGPEDPAPTGFTPADIIAVADSLHTLDA